MSSTEIISLVVTLIGIFSFASIFTVLYGSYASMSIKEINSGKRDIEIIDEMIHNNKDSVKKRSKIMGYVKSVIFYLTMCIVILKWIF